MRNNPTSKSPKPLLSVEEADDLLGENRSTLYWAIKGGTFPLPIFRIGQRIRIPRRSVERLLAGLPLIPPEDARVALEFSGLAKGQTARAARATPAVEIA